MAPKGSGSNESKGITSETAHSVRMETLQEVLVAVSKQERKFKASRVLKFNKYKYFFGIAKSYLMVFLFAAYPHLYWCFHAIGMCIMIPIQVWRWTRTKDIFYMVEFCWITSFLIGSYLTLLLSHSILTDFNFLGATGFGGEHSLIERMVGVHNFEIFREKMGLLIFACGAGPLGFAVVSLGNSLVPHSIDHSMSLMIHFHNLITAYSIMFKLKDAPGADSATNLFGDLHHRDKNFVEYVTPALVWYAAWWIIDTIFLQVYAIKHLGPLTSPYTSILRDQLNPPPGRSTPFTKVLGRLGSGGSDRVRVFLYSLLYNIGMFITFYLSYLFYKYDTQDGHYLLCYLLFVFFIAIKNGAQWYSRNMSRFSKLVEDMIKAEEQATEKSK
mmetsp:Transcript_24548/g.29747  ORF Transcript_24548/g.29747 Transcript_24548/m.29747 type:complete len:385 (+) Transcript_24548:273-1427(+)